MAEISKTIRQRLVAQGFDLSDDEIVAFNYWLRFAPALTGLWVFAGVVLTSPWILLALVPFTLLASIRASHPFEAYYNHGMRYLIGSARLPAYGAPRRFACLMASIMVSLVAILFGFGFDVAGYVIGTAMILMSLLMVLTGKCGPCAIYNLILGPVEKPKSVPTQLSPCKGR